MPSIIEALKQGKTINSGSRIKLPVEGLAEIYGFVPYHDDTFSSIGLEKTPTCPPLGPANIIGNRIIFSIEGNIYRAPLFKALSIAEEKYPIYLLYVPRLLNLSAESRIKAYLSSFKNEKPSPYINQVDGIRIVDKEPFYFPNEDEYLFTSSSKLKGIGNSFAVITRRLSKDNGLLLYEVYDPQDVEVIRFTECDE